MSKEVALDNGIDGGLEVTSPLSEEEEEEEGGRRGRGPRYGPGRDLNPVRG